LLQVYTAYLAGAEQSEGGLWIDVSERWLAVRLQHINNSFKLTQNQWSCALLCPANPM